jgi:adenylate kinase family enzyme
MPGAGKTTLANSLLEDPSLILLDDLSLYSEPLKKLEGLSQDVIIADPYLCLEDVRIEIEEELYRLYPDIVIQYIYFENNAEQCRENVNFRQDGRKVDKLIGILSGKYNIPKGAIVMDVPNAKLKNDANKRPSI